MRVSILVYAALLLIFNTAKSGFAQTVETIELQPARAIDGLYIDDAGALHGAGTFQGANIFQIGSDGATAAIASGLSGPIQTTRSTDGNLYVTNFNAGSVSRVMPDGTITAFASVKDGPSGIVSDQDGNLYISHYGTGNGTGDSITKIAPNGTVTDFASGGTINVPVGLAIDDESNLYAANLLDGRITKITSAGEQSLFAQVPLASPFTIGHLVWANGRLYGTHVGQHQIYAIEQDSAFVYAGSGTAGREDGPAAVASFASPNGLAASLTGDTLYVAEAFGFTSRLRMIIAATATHVEKPVEQGDASQLFQNFPNPFQDETTIQFYLEETEHVALDVFDILGRHVETLTSGSFASGKHTVVWEAKDVAPGIYVYQLTTAHQSSKHVMILQ